MRGTVQFLHVVGWVLGRDKRDSVLQDKCIMDVISTNLYPSCI